MLAAALRSPRNVAVVARAGARASRAAALSTSAIRREGHIYAPNTYGPGAKAGEIPTDQAQSTGLERIQTYGNLQGVSVFDLEPLDASRVGTLKDPIMVFSTFPERIIGCTGCPAESHETLWFTVKAEETKRCPECGSAYALDYDHSINETIKIESTDPIPEEHHGHAH